MKFEVEVQRIGPCGSVPRDSVQYEVMLRGGGHEERGVSFNLGEAFEEAFAAIVLGVAEAALAGNQPTYPRGTRGSVSEAFGVASPYSVAPTEQAHDTYPPPIDPRVGEIHGDDMCSEAVGGAHSWNRAAFAPKEFGDVSPDHEAERMNLACCLLCVNGACTAWAEYAEGYPRDEQHPLRITEISIGDLAQANSPEALQAGNLVVPVEVQLAEPESITPQEVPC